MTRTELKQLIREVVMETMVPQYSAEFETEVDIDLHKMGKGSWIVDDVPVKIEVAGNYEDNRFDWEAGEQRGTHDPGSGIVATEIKIISVEDVFMRDQKGNEILSQLLIKAGQEIPENFIEKKSLERLYLIANNQLEKRSQYEPDVDDGPINE